MCVVKTAGILNSYLSCLPFVYIVPDYCVLNIQFELLPDAVIAEFALISRRLIVLNDNACNE